MQLTAEESKAIKDLQSLAKRWPKTLWLFVGSAFNSMCVMHVDSNGKRAYLGDGGGVNHDYIVGNIDNIPCEGGDF